MKIHYETSPGTSTALLALRLETPVCARSEVKWWRYLISEINKEVPRLVERTILVYNPFDKTLSWSEAIQKQQSKLDDRQTWLCLTGCLAGALCADLAIHLNDLETYWPELLHEEIPTEAEAIALRPIRRNFSLPIEPIRSEVLTTDMYDRHQLYESAAYIHRDSEVGADWFLNALLKFLCYLEIPHDESKIRLNAFNIPEARSGLE